MLGKWLPVRLGLTGADFLNPTKKLDIGTDVV